VNTFEVKTEITEEVVAPVINALGQAIEGDDIKVLLPYNLGGSVDAALNLIKAVETTQGNVVVELDRYAISAAAFIWVWFLLNPTTNVIAQTTGQPALLVYHRPRITVDEHLLFLDDIDDEHQQDLKKPLLKGIVIFDEIFEKLIAAVGYVSDNENTLDYRAVQIKHKLKHARDGYYSNQDFVISV
jgi:hypothetical protein